MTSLSDHKKALRAQMRRLLAGIDPAELAAASEAVCGHIAGCRAFARAGVVMIFLPLAGEVDLRGLAQAAWAKGKRVVVPLADYVTRSMRAVELGDLSEPLVGDRYGVMVPADVRPVEISRVDLVLTPGLAFDRVGHRLGRGAGFYDRFLSDPAFRGLACGVTLERQLVEAVPCESHDAGMAMLVSEAGVVSFRAGD